MIKMIFKLFKYSLIIYLMVCFKNLYSETFNDNSFITVSMPDIIDINEVNGQDSIDNNKSIFAEKMEYYSLDNQKKLDEEQRRLEEAQKQMVTAGTYRELLENGVSQEEIDKVQEFNNKTVKKY